MPVKTGISKRPRKAYILLFLSLKPGIISYYLLVGRIIQYTHKHFDSHVAMTLGIEGITPRVLIETQNTGHVY